jgi:hypothetical protein
MSSLDGRLLRDQRSPNWSDRRQTSEVCRSRSLAAWSMDAPAAISSRSRALSASVQRRPAGPLGGFGAAGGRRHSKPSFLALRRTVVWDLWSLRAASAIEIPAVASSRSFSVSAAEKLTVPTRLATALFRPANPEGGQPSY